MKVLPVGIPQQAAFHPANIRYHHLTLRMRLPPVSSCRVLHPADVQSVIPLSEFGDSVYISTEITLKSC